MPGSVSTGWVNLAEGTSREEARKVDQLLEIGADALGSFFKNATVEDIITWMESYDDVWTLDRYRELRDKMNNILLRQAGAIGDQALYASFGTLPEALQDRLSEVLGDVVGEIDGGSEIVTKREAVLPITIVS
jgi:hypothetical protein